jgi:cysteine-rich repeat protein
VGEGSNAELRYRTAFAARVVLGREGEPGRVLEAATGTAEVGPLERTGVWVLAAESPSGRVEAQARIEVEAETRPEVRVTRFEAAPARVPAGTEVRLRWAVENAGGPVRIVAGDDVVVEAGAASGEATWRVERTTAFALSVPGYPRPALASATVVVEDVEPGAIVDFSAVPRGARPPLPRPRGVLLRWETRGGAALELGEAGQSLITFTQPDALARGAWLVAPAEGGATTYRARLADGTSSPPTRQLTVRVAEPAPPPTIARFEVTPEVLAGDEATRAEVRWQVSGPSPRVRLLGAGNSVPLSPSGQRTIALSGERTAILRLEAETDGGLAEARDVVWRVVGEAEDNDRPGDARELDRVAAAGEVRTAGVLADEDWFEVEAEDGGRLEARLLPPCERGLRLAVFDEQARGLGEATATGSSCPRVVVSPTRDSYFVRVDRPGLLARARYRVVLDAVGPACGDGRRAPSEGCDDGGRVPGDGCSAACTVEPGWRYRVDRTEDGLESFPAGAGLRLYAPSGADPADAGFAVVDLETWTFPFFGEAHAGFAVHVDGYLSFFPDRGAADLTDPLGAGAPNALIAPFIADLRVVAGSRVAAAPGRDAAGEPVMDVVFEGLEPKAAPGARVGAVVRLSRDGEIRVVYASDRTNGADAVTVVAGLDAPRGARAVLAPGCDAEGCPFGQLRGSAVVYRPD